MTSLALIGGQYGSEGKGVIAAGMAWQFAAAVRTGGPNAGHSFYHQRQLYKMRQVPCAWVNPATRLYLGAGAVIDPALLIEEAKRAGRIVTVDPQAAIIQPHHHKTEREQGMREAIGSTTEGVGAARIEKIARDGTITLARDFDWYGLEQEAEDWVVIDEVAPQLWATSGLIMLEGTQGSGLSLHHGRYPFVTSNDTNAAQLAADAGLPPSAVQHTHLVIRTHPIRVAGNSGETGGLEMDWDSLMAQGVVERPERTTVTNNVRRLFTYSRDDVERAIGLNDPCGLWVTFGDYIDPKARDADNIDDLMATGVGQWLRENVMVFGIRLLGVGVGGDFWRVIETGDVCSRRSGSHLPMPWPLSVRNDEVLDAVAH